MSVSHEHENKSHARPNYFGVFVGLGVLTLLEVGVTFLPVPQVPLLVAMMVAKVVLVGMYYMHLKYDSKWFTVIILTPAPFVALIVVITGGAVVGSGVALAFLINQLDKAYRQALHADSEAVAEKVEMAVMAVEEHEEIEIDIHLPSPSPAPIIVAAGVTLLGIGLVVLPVGAWLPLFVAGAVVLLAGIGGWAFTSESE